MKDIIYARYAVKISDTSCVYDGDTIERVCVKLHGLQAVSDAHFGEVWPDIFVDDEGAWVHQSIRIAGIDCPEMKPHHFDSQNHLRMHADLESEKAAAVEARNYVISLLKPNNLRFELRNPQRGKFDGRTVAEVWCLEHGAMINIARRLIDKKLGYPYFGGEKRDWDYGASLR